MLFFRGLLLYGGFDKALSGMEYVLVGSFDYGNCSLLVQKAPQIKVFVEEGKMGYAGKK